MSSDIVTVDLLVEGGKATPGGSMGPALGPTGVNIKQVVDEINKQTEAYRGMKVPVQVTVNKKARTFELSIGIPPASALVIQAAGASKGSGDQKTKVGDISFQSLIDAAKAKWPDLTAASLGAACKELLGSCLCCGITCEGKEARVIQKEIDKGVYDEILAKNEE